MMIEFKLSMPNVGSWNGRWTGEDNYYAKVLNITDKAIVDQILDKSFYYNFGDGWGMSVSVRKVDSKEAAKIRRKSRGFMGYDWAVESIIKNQKIIC